MMHAFQLGTYSKHLGYSRNPVLCYSISYISAMFWHVVEHFSFSVFEAVCF